MSGWVNNNILRIERLDENVSDTCANKSLSLPDYKAFVAWIYQSNMSALSRFSSLFPMKTVPSTVVIVMCVLHLWLKSYKRLLFLSFFQLFFYSKAYIWSYGYDDNDDHVLFCFILHNFSS